MSGEGRGAKGQRHVGNRREGEHLDPTEAFKIIGNETRLAILQELLAAKNRPLTFTELRKRVGMRDGSQFNYHLGKLVPNFAERTAEGFHINQAGAQVVRAITAGSFTDNPTIPPFPVDGTCVACGGGLSARYEEELALVNCVDCNLLHYLSVFSPGGLVGRTPAEVLAASDRRIRASYFLSMSGVCPGCTGTNRRTVLGPTDPLPADILHVKIPETMDAIHGPGVVYECEHCDVWYYLTMGETLLFEPAVVEFFRDHGRDLFAEPLWTLPWCVPASSREYATIVTTDPLRVTVRILLDDETLAVTIDEKLQVEDTTRTADTPSTVAGDAG
ncbi:winged helix-turn-helix domain-containing protein [Haladaptatus sp. GCM10025707]|uniref:winged helix-turn-helix domain-containing protein n=1 Tax=unclassified Haladaptatus TaxID=2622732 RepID=UPI0023E82EF2|nr:helix-turn-helix domain-containing protein [Haladaptatus sp. QDMS2]